MIVWQSRVGREGQEEGITKEHKATFGGDEYFECGDAFTGIVTSQSFSDCIL